jgi:hypothetical protein
MTRLGRAWRAMEPEQRLAAIAALGLFVSMFLPWYSQTNAVVVGGRLRSSRTSLSAFEAFSFVEAAVLLVSAGVLAMLFARAERHAFQLPGGDGTVTMIAGGWTALLIFYRLLDKPGLQGTQRITSTVGVQWGIFIALLLALALVYAGRRMRAAERPGPPLTRSQRRRPQPGEAEQRRPAERRPAEPPPAEPPPAEPPPDEPVTMLGGAPARPKRTAPVPADRRPPPPRPRYPPAPSGQMSFEDTPPGSD